MERYQLTNVAYPMDSWAGGGDVRNQRTQQMSHGNDDDDDSSSITDTSATSSVSGRTFSGLRNLRRQRSRRRKNTACTR